MSLTPPPRSLTPPLLSPSPVTFNANDPASAPSTLLRTSVPTMEFIKTLPHYRLFLLQELGPGCILIKLVFEAGKKGDKYSTEDYVKREVENWMDRGVYVEERDGEEAQKLKKKNFHWRDRTA